MHGLDSNTACLRRWGSISERPMPQDWAAFKKAHLNEALQIELRDAELVSLLAMTAPANLRADAITGKLSPVTPDPAEIASQQKKERLKQLVAQKPYENGEMKNFTAAMEIDNLDPALGARLRKEAGYQSPEERKAEAAAGRKAHKEWMESVTTDALLRSLQQRTAGAK